MIYDLLAPIYDSINRDIDYQAWADFIEKIFERELKVRPELVLDLGCGTGSMTLELARRGYDMTGIDYSAEMLDIARERAEKEGLSGILWLLQDMRSFELYGTVDATLCCLDGINHLLTVRELRECLALVHNYLSPDGLFIFDVNGRYKFENIYADRSYVMDEDKAFCIWQNDYNEKSKICNFYITVFREDEGGLFERYDEMQRERMYTLRTLNKALLDTGFEPIGAYSDLAFTEATDNDERIYIVARCKKK